MKFLYIFQIHKYSSFIWNNLILCIWELLTFCSLSNAKLYWAYFCSIIKELDLPWKSQCLSNPSQHLTHLPEGGRGAHAWNNTIFWCSFWNVYVWIQRLHWAVATWSWLYILILFSSQLCRLQGWERLLEEWTNHLREDAWEWPAGYRDVWLSNTVDKKPLPLAHGWVQPQVCRASWLRFWSALEEQRYYEHVIKGPWLGDTKMRHTHFTAFS